MVKRLPEKSRRDCNICFEEFPFTLTAPILAKDADYNVYFNNAVHTPLRCCNSTHTV